MHSALWAGAQSGRIVVSRFKTSIASSNFPRSYRSLALSYRVSESSEALVSFARSWPNPRAEQSEIENTITIRHLRLVLTSLSEWIAPGDWDHAELGNVQILTALGTGSVYNSEE